MWASLDLAGPFPGRTGPALAPSGLVAITYRVLVTAPFLRRVPPLPLRLQKASEPLPSQVRSQQPAFACVAGERGHHAAAAMFRARGRGVSGSGALDMLEPGRPSNFGRCFPPGQLWRRGLLGGKVTVSGKLRGLVLLC